MSKTGRYVWDAERHTFVQLTERVPTPYRDLRNGVWWPQGESAYYDRQAARTFHSKSEKAEWMRQVNVIEHTPTEQNPLKGLPEAGHWKPQRHKGVLHV